MNRRGFTFTENVSFGTKLNFFHAHKRDYVITLPFVI